MPARPEEKMHFQICDYLKIQYPKIFFISESSGLRVSPGLASKLKKTRSNHTHLDLYVLEPKGQYHALILELKAKNIYKKDGALFKDDHLADQQRTIDALNKKGYKSMFAVTFVEAKKIIDAYLNGNTH
jgi:hypothetical protein